MVLEVTEDLNPGALKHWEIRKNGPAKRLKRIREKKNTSR